MGWVELVESHGESVEGLGAIGSATAALVVQTVVTQGVWVVASGSTETPKKWAVPGSATASTRTPAPDMR